MRVVDLDFVPNSRLTLECIAEDIEFQDLAPLDHDSNQALPPPASSTISDESTYHVALDMKSTWMSAKVMARYLLTKGET
jgi:hypothetical protein